MGQLPHKLEAVGAKGRAGQFSLNPPTTPWPREAIPAMYLSLSAPFSWLLQLVRVGWTKHLYEVPSNEIRVTHFLHDSKLTFDVAIYYYFCDCV